MKQGKPIDYTEFGEDWVNLILDLKLALQDVPQRYPHFVFYTWDVAKEEGQDAVGVEWDGDYLDGCAYAFYTAFKQEKTLIPVIAMAMARFIEEEPNPEKREKYKEAIFTIFKSNGEETESK